MKINFLDRFSTNIQISNAVKIHAVGTELFHADGRTHRHDKKLVAFRNFENVPILIFNAIIFVYKFSSTLTCIKEVTIICIYLFTHFHKITI